LYALKDYIEVLKSRNSVFVITANAFTVFALAYLLAFYIVMIINEVGGAFSVGLYFTTITTLSLISPFLGGYFSNLFGRKCLLLLSTIGLAFTLLIFSTLPLKTPTLLLILASFVYFLNSLASPAKIDLLTENLTKKYTGKALAILFFSETIIAITSYLTFGFLLSKTNRSIAILLSAIIISISLIPLNFIHETLKPRIKYEGLFAFTRSFRDLKFLVQSRILLLFLISISFNNFYSSIASPYVIPFLQSIRMLTVEEISRLYTGIAIAVLVGYLIAGHVVDKLGSILSLILLNSLALILIPTFALAPILIALICFTLLSFLDSLNIARDKFVIENVNPEHRSLMLGSYRSITALPRIIGPLIGSILWNISPILVFIATAMLIPIDISILTILYFTLKSKSYATNKSTN